MIRDALNKLLAKENLSEQEMIHAMNDIMEGKVSEMLIASFLTALRMKGETAQEISGGAKVMKEKSSKIDMGESFTVDTCGTGGDGADTYNISTAAAFVGAAAGVKVVKHGNRSVSSKSGSADVLEKLGININLTPEQIKECINRNNIGFMFAPLFHKAMKYAMPVRKELKIRTIFNVLGPLTNPAKARAQVLGVFSPELTEIIAEALRNLGTEHALVVYGMDKLDEISISTKTKVSELKDGKIRTYFIEPKDFGLAEYSLTELKGGESEENAKIIKDIFTGKLTGAKKDILLLNAGAVLYVGKKSDSLANGVKMAKEIIESGKAMEKLNEFANFSSKLGVN